MSGHNRVWAESCLGTVVSGHSRVWAQSCGPSHVGPIMYGHKRGGTRVFMIATSLKLCKNPLVLGSSLWEVFFFRSFFVIVCNYTDFTENQQRHQQKLTVENYKIELLRVSCIFFYMHFNASFPTLAFHSFSQMEALGFLPITTHK